MLTFRLGTRIHDLPGLEDGTVVANLSPRLLLAFWIDVYANDAAVTVTEAACHELLHGDLRGNAEPLREAVGGAGEPVRTADVNGVEPSTLGKPHQMVRHGANIRLFVCMGDDRAPKLRENVERNEVRLGPCAEKSKDFDGLGHGLVDEGGEEGRSGDAA